jgi:diaminohydroxyphosphoribosylaminopyrimidine deaminase / 5-amino-6-(5-phosphoribosylamino)uracil reductase
MTESLDVKYMRRALELAVISQGHVSPNPMVGCVIVRDGIIIGDGWHKVYGQAHAEVNAVNSVVEKTSLEGSTVYVTLEPCSHFGKTPPCADMLIEKKVGRVVICNHDTNPLVGGKGMKKLQDAGIEVTSGVLENEGRDLNRRFFTYIEKQRPYIILKWAQTADGFIARENFDSKWISNELSRILVHKWRSEEDAILVGSNTTLHDDPQLNVRDWSGRNPIRIVLDRHSKLPSTRKLFDGSQMTICYTENKNSKSHNLEFVKIEDDDFINGVVKDLYQRKIQSVMVEGGSEILNAFIKKDLWDEARVFTAPINFEKGIKAPSITPQYFEDTTSGIDKLTICRNQSR